MLKLGNKPAVRTFASSEEPPIHRKRLLRSALGLVRPMRPATSYDEAHRIFRKVPLLFALDDIESELLGNLLRSGYGTVPGFFSKGLIDRIYSKADAIFRTNASKSLGLQNAGSIDAVNDRAIEDAAGAQGRLVEIVAPLASIPETLDIVFHESLLKIAANFFRHIPRVYKVSVVRYFAGRQPVRLSGVYETFGGSMSLCVIVDLMDIDESRGPLVYIPDQHYVHKTKSDGAHATDADATPRDKWVTLRGERGSISAIPRRSVQSSLWTYSADVKSNPRTSIVINVAGYKSGEPPLSGQNPMLRWNFDRMTALQQMFAYPAFVHEAAPTFAKVS